jgi:hypothetical protein
MAQATSDRKAHAANKGWQNGGRRKLCFVKSSVDCPLTVRFSADTTELPQHNISQPTFVGQSLADL